MISMLCMFHCGLGSRRVVKKKYIGKYGSYAVRLVSQYYWSCRYIVVELDAPGQNNICLQQLDNGYFSLDLVFDFKADLLLYFKNYTILLKKIQCRSIAGLIRKTIFFDILYHTWL